MIDADGYRANVGIVLLNDINKVFWGQRVGRQDAWQFPQGGIQQGEAPEAAMFRELAEEVGLQAQDVRVLAGTDGWLRYDLPEAYRRHGSKPLCIGQKQKWFLLRLLTADAAINLDYSNKPEFTSWQWVDYWHPVQHVVAFKQAVYQQALQQLHPFIGG